MFFTKNTLKMCYGSLHSLFLWVFGFFTKKSVPQTALQFLSNQSYKYFTMVLHRKTGRKWLSKKNGVWDYKKYGPKTGLTCVMPVCMSHISPKTQFLSQETSHRIPYAFLQPTVTHYLICRFPRKTVRNSKGKKTRNCHVLVFLQKCP